MNEANPIFIRKSIERSVRDLPALPASVMRVLEEMDSPDPSASRIEAHVLADQALTGQVLRVVNSAYYGMSRQISSVSQAVVILGLHQLRNIVLSVGTMAAFEVKNPRFAAEMQEMWIRAFATASVAQQIGKQIRLDPRSVETLFIGALLHDLGRFFLFLSFNDLFEQVRDQAPLGTPQHAEAEKTVYGISHGQVGALIATQWRLPESLVDIIAGHEGPFEAGVNPLLVAVHLAEATVRHGMDYEAFLWADVPMDFLAREWARRDDQSAAIMKGYALAKVEEAKALFSLPVAA